MAVDYAVVRGPRRRQPLGVVGINRKNKLLAGNKVLCLVSGTSRLNLGTLSMMTVGGTVSQAGKPDGMTIFTGASAGELSYTTDALGTNACAEFWVGYWNSSVTQVSDPYVLGDYNGSGFGIHGASNGGGQWGFYDGGTLRSSGETLVDGRVYCIVAVRHAAATGHKVYRDGILFVTGTATGSHNTGFAINSIGPGQSGTFGASCFTLLAGRIDCSARPWTVGDVQDFCANPWQLLTEKKNFWAFPGSLNTYLQNVTGTLSSSASLASIRNLKRTLTASRTLSATRVRAIAMIRVASSTLSASLAKVSALKRAITATATSISASLTKSKAVNRALSASAAASAALVRSVGRVRSATSSIAATRSRAIQMVRSASSTVTATMSRIRALKRTIAATAMTVSASLSRVRSLKLAASASASLSATRVRTVKMIRSTTTGTSASMTRSKVLLKAITASVSLAATKIRQFARVRSATIGRSATMSRLRAIGKALTASAALSASVRRVFSFIPKASQHIAASVSRGSRGIIEMAVGLTLNPTVTRIRALKRTVTASTTWAPSIRKAVRMARTVVVPVIPTRLRSFPYHVSASVTTVVATLRPARVRVLAASTHFVATIGSVLAQIGAVAATLVIRPAVGAIRALMAAVGGKPRIEDDH